MFFFFFSIRPLTIWVFLFLADQVLDFVIWIQILVCHLQICLLSLLLIYKIAVSFSLLFSSRQRIISFQTIVVSWQLYFLSKHTRANLGHVFLISPHSLALCVSIPHRKHFPLKSLIVSGHLLYEGKFDILLKGSVSPCVSL